MALTLAVCIHNKPIKYKTCIECFGQPRNEAASQFQIDKLMNSMNTLAFEIAEILERLEKVENDMAKIDDKANYVIRLLVDKLSTEVNHVSNSRG